MKLDKKGNVIDFFAIPIHRVPIKEIFEPYQFKRSSSRILNTNRSEINHSRHSSSQIRSSAEDFTVREYRSGQPSNRIKLKPISTVELQKIIDKHKQNLQKDGGVGVVILKMNNSGDKSTEEPSNSQRDSQSNEKTNQQPDGKDLKTGDTTGEQKAEQRTEQKVEEKVDDKEMFITQN